MTPAITRYVNLLARNRAALLAAAERISPEDWRKAPSPGRWSAAEVFAHLTQVEAQVMRGAARVLSAPPKPTSWRERLHIPVRFTEFRIRRVTAPSPIDPQLLGEKQPMLEKFAAVRQETLEFIRASQDRDLRPYRFPHPFLGSLNVYDWFRMLAYHEARHTKQLREIAESLQS